MNKVVNRLSEWLPIVLLTLGTLWVLQGVLSRTTSHGVIIRGVDYDAGAVKSGTIITNNIHLINLSGQSVTVDAQPGCGCTVVDVPSGPLKPLHGEVIETQIDTDGLSTGQQSKGIDLGLQSGSTNWHEIALTRFHLRP